MSWFERHLNWSLVLAIMIVPMIVVTIFLVIFFVSFYGAVSSLEAAGAGAEAIESFMFTTAFPFVIAYFILMIGLTIFDLVVTWWYLGQKARSRWFVLLLFAPFGLIILLLLENQAIMQQGDFAYEAATDQWSAGSQYAGGNDERQLKELDYTPSKNVLDIVDGPPLKDVKYTTDVPLTGGGGAEQATSEAAAAEEKVADKPVSQSVSQHRLQMPILLDDSGAPISCFYHPGADAVNLCSRCKQYVCVECNYVTGTHPICRNCWEKRADIPVAPPVQKASPAPPKPEKQITAEAPVLETKEEPRSAETEELNVPESVRQETVLAQEPEKQAPIPPVAPAIPEPTKGEELKEAISAKPQRQKIVEPVKSAKQAAERNVWQQEFMSLYRQASPIINVIIKRDVEGMPASPLDLMEGLKLRPILDLVKKLSKPKDKDLREAKSELEHLMSSCIKIADTAADFISGGGQALLGGPDFKRIVDGIETANGLMDKLSQKIPAFSRPQE